MTGTPIGSAVLSQDGRYRYVLSRHPAPLLDRRVVFVMLNPSTADHLVDDPTIRRCLGFAARWGCGRLDVVNLFALRSTDPKALRDDPDPIGPNNDRHIVDTVEGAHLVVAAWGAMGSLRSRDTQVRALLAGRCVLHCLGTTNGGAPRHPLYLPAIAPLVPYGDRSHAALEARR